MAKSIPYTELVLAFGVLLALWWYADLRNLQSYRGLSTRGNVVTLPFSSSSH